MAGELGWLKNNVIKDNMDNEDNLNTQYEDHMEEISKLMNQKKDEIGQKKPNVKKVYAELLKKEQKILENKQKVINNFKDGWKGIFKMLGVDLKESWT